MKECNGCALCKFEYSEERGNYLECNYLCHIISWIDDYRPKNNPKIIADVCPFHTLDLMEQVANRSKKNNG